MKEQAGPPGSTAAAQPGRRLGSPRAMSGGAAYASTPTFFSMPLPPHTRQILGRRQGELPSALDLFLYTYIYALLISFNLHAHLQDLCNLNSSVPCMPAQPNAYHLPHEWINDLFLSPHKPLTGVQEAF